METPSFQYRALESPTTIRVLVLQSAENLQDPLKAQLVHVNRDDLLAVHGTPNFYEAVSYCWGVPDLSHVLLIEDFRFRITANVDALLRHLRRSRKARYLWIDALCLNQEDRAEKEVQVQLMGRIYAQAAKIHVWIGTAEAHQRIPQLYNVLKWMATCLKNKEKLASGEIEAVLTTTYGADWRQAWNEFYSQPYFQRRWILQEVALGHHITMHCGPWKLSWQWFIQGTKGLQIAIAEGLDFSIEPKAATALDTILAIQDSNNLKLLALLWKFHESQCSMFQDKIFALYGLAQDAKEITKIDYSKPWSEAFTAVAGAYFEHDKRSIWLHLAHFGSLAGFLHPSWVPNWTNTRSHTSISPDNNTALLSYNGFKHSRFSYDPDLRAVEFDSYYAGRIDNMSDSDSATLQDDNNIVWDEGQKDALSEVLLAFFLRPHGSPTERFTEAMRLHDVLLDRHTIPLRDALLSILRLLGPWNPAPPTTPTPPLTPLQAAVQTLLTAIWTDYSILHIRGKRDAMGLGPRAITSQDILLVPPQGPMSSVYWPYRGHPRFGVVVRPVTQASLDYVLAQRYDSPWKTLRGCAFVGLCAFALWEQECRRELSVMRVELV